MAPARKAALIASSSFKNQDQSTSEEEQEENGSGHAWDLGEPSKPMPRVKNKYGGAKKRGRASTGSAVNFSEIVSQEGVSMTPHRQQSKRKLSHSPARSEATSINYTPLRADASLRDIMDGLMPKTSSVLRQPTTPRKSMSSVSVPPVSSTNISEKWSLANLGSFVWVRIDHKGEVYNEGQDDVDTFWWPANASKFAKSKPLEVTFFGKISEHAPAISQIRSPSATNVLSMTLPNGLVRFNQYNYTHVDSSSGVAIQGRRSPRKKQHTDICRRWGEAADAMIIADANANGGLSARLSGFSDVKKLGPLPRNIEGSSSLSEGDLNLSDGDNYDIEVDPMLKIPGELVFSREGKTKTEYWPAKVLKYIPAQKKKGTRKSKPKYQLLFLDQKQKAFDRDFFFSSFQEEFKTCKLGKFESDNPLEINGEDDSDLETDERQRSLSPAPENPPPNGSAFCKLDLHAQFAYVKPVLVAILNEQYPPASVRHRKFMQGGSARTKLGEDAGRKGGMTAAEVSKLTKFLTRWALREKAKAELILDEEQHDKQTLEDKRNVAEPPKDDELEGLSPLSDLSASEPPSSFPLPPEQGYNSTKEDVVQGLVNGSTTNSSHPPCQEGCPAYERLTITEKLDYCTNVLVPEAVIQTLLWRAGKRDTMELLSDQEEEDLHQVGMKLAQESDWVNEIMQLRKKLERDTQMTAEVISGGTRSRPKFKTVRQ